MDAQTQQALRDFQKANDLPATGVLDEKTANKLGVNISRDQSPGKPVPQRESGTTGSVPGSGTGSGNPSTPPRSPVQ